MIEYENLQKSNKLFEKEYQAAFAEFLQSGHYILGEKLKQFEELFSTYCQTSYCVGVGNGFDALVLALKSFDFPKGSEVIVPSHTFIATIFAILHCDLIPVLIEPDVHTYNLDVSTIEQAVTSKTKAIMPVHMYGTMCDMGKVMELASSYQLFVIEDCAQSHGATYFGKTAGSIGDAGAFSFYPVKNLGALGDGGAVVSNDVALTNRLKYLRNYGSPEKYKYETIGHNSRLDELQASMLIVKLRKLDILIEHKKALAAEYRTRLSKKVVLRKELVGYEETHSIFPIRHGNRDALRHYLFEKGVKTEIHYPIPPHKQKAIKHLYAGKSFPICEELHSTLLSLPIAFHHTKADIEYICEVINAF